MLDEYKQARGKIRVKHSLCGNIYSVTPDNLLRGKRCPICSSSKGEDFIAKTLKEMGISFIPEYKFNDLYGLGGGLLRYDFAIFDKDKLQLLIEYQGEQHYHVLEGWITEQSFEKQVRHDELKREYCEENKIRLLEIPYWDYENIEYILDKNLIIN